MNGLLLVRMTVVVAAGVLCAYASADAIAHGWKLPNLFFGALSFASFWALHATYRLDHPVRPDNTDRWTVRWPPRRRRANRSTT